MKLKTMVYRILLSLLAFALLGGTALAQNYPVKPVRWIVPMPPGGGTDLVSRTITIELAKLWGVSVLADNRPGAGGTIGMELAIRSPGDGYTIVLGQASNVAVAPALYKKLSYDPVKELAPITNVIAAPLVVVSHPSLPARNAKELIALIRSKPGAVTFGSSGNGTIGHLSLEMLKSDAKLQMLHIPYNGAARALTALLSGEIVIYSSSMPPALPHIKTGRLKALGVTTSKRLTPLPDIPTIAESGVTDFEAVNWYGVFAPIGVPKDIMAKLHTDIVRVLKQPDVQARFAGEGGDVVANTPEEFAAFVRKEIPKWARVIQASGAKVD
jgi:tripartite-type tricarboxylate transporter receptor subunit TctC